MSSALLNCVPVLTGANWIEWSEAIKAFLMSVGQLVAGIQDATGAKEMYDVLKGQYGKPGIAAVFTDFKCAIDYHIPNNKHPAAAIDNIIMFLTRIAANSPSTGTTTTSMAVPKFIQAMLIVSKLPDRYSYVVQTVAQTPMDEIITKLTLEHIREAAVHAWEGRSKCNDSNAGKSANKLSAVKRKDGDPDFKSQQKHQNTGAEQQTKQDGDGKKKRQRGKRSGKGKEKANSADDGGECSHTMSPTIVMDPAALDVRCPFFSPAPKPFDTFFTSTKRSINLVQDIGLKPTCERVRALEDVVMSDSLGDAALEGAGPS
ncbi:hypothetical protein K435DRAFT_850792 [Dendrothele bispora CBS 962.96]|uniref:DUF4219 domain-containing protein n=1 Tax=Dendrothele bispora (strain CBS 962.96) TaxID=1314807 RepID=A0A4S8MNY0_DENBC|nr:hypothetical protein K435DRAFT_850792 [Dendrothele bispora CBS 962.96]